MNIRIKTIARWLQFLILIYFAWCVCCTVMTWYAACHNGIDYPGVKDFVFNSQFFKLYIYYNQQFIDPQTLDMSKVAATIGFMGSVFYLTFMGYIVNKSLRLFELLKQGRIFSLHHTELFKSISMAVFLFGSIALIISEMCTGLALSFDQGTGKRIVQISFGTPNLTIMFWSGIAYIVSHIMKHGTDLYNDQQLVI